MVVIGLFRLLLLAIASVLITLTQPIFLLLCKSKRIYILPKLWHGGMCHNFNIRTHLSGHIEKDKQTLYVANHISYLDIPVLGSYLDASFIAKADVSTWPVFGFLATLQQTVFIERTKEGLPTAQKDIEDRLKRGQNLILFAEGTSTPGHHVLPFKSSLFELVNTETLKKKLYIQPVTIQIRSVNGKTPETLTDHDIYAWHGDMTLPPHLWKIAKNKSVDIDIHFHPSMPLSQFNNRKDIAKKTQKIVADHLQISFDPKK